MTRISSNRVIQMVGDDRVVFVNDSTMQEHVLKIIDLPNTLIHWYDAAARGVNYGPEGIEFRPDQFEAVKQTLYYFIDCSHVPLSEQLERITVIQSEPGEPIEDFMRRAGIL